jgi:hypothetical protein
MGRGLANQEELVKRRIMYNFGSSAVVVGAGALGGTEGARFVSAPGGIATGALGTGINVVFLAMLAFVLIALGFAALRMIPRKNLA